jgi:hypothetical protein
MQQAESASQYIERLSALPPKERLEEFRAIADPALRRQVAKGLPGELHSEILDEAMLQGLNRNVLAQQKSKQTA